MNKYLSLIYASIFLSIALATSACSNNIDKSEQSNVDSNSQPVSMPASTDSSTNSSTESTEKMQFICGSTYNDRLNQKVPTTIAWKSSDRRAIVQWTKPMDDYWSPEKRCEQVSTQMNQAFEAGTLKYITNGKMNGQNVICTATEVKGDCQNLLMTLRSEDKPLQFLGELKDIFNGRAAGAIEHSSSNAQVYIAIDLQSMWKNAPSAK
jgi:Circadian oscillating protein COP23